MTDAVAVGGRTTSSLTPSAAMANCDGFVRKLVAVDLRGPTQCSFKRASQTWLKTLLARRWRK
jgi:hypothetical protein